MPLLLEEITVKITTKTLRAKKGKTPIVCCTAYDALIATVANQAGVDLILVGDSMGNVILGFDNTIPVTLDMIVHHTAAVTRTKPAALVVADIPFAVAHQEPAQVLRAAMRLMQEAGADAVKIEGGESLAKTIALLTDAGIPVLGHIGLQPQQVAQLGGYKKFGKSQSDREKLLNDAACIEEAGVFGMVAEMLDHDSAKALQEATSTPIIGIGAGLHCDGQILVTQDLLGMTPNKPPSFVKQYASIYDAMKKGIGTYAQEVRERKFPE